ncbi:MAG TPA: hypothetical protein VGN73_11870 [Gemmatimonadaceae bacterium]|jgi:hypothetical protein|nr:hypothetical protein [Gemmatimonadaceae bacterium]
MTFFVALDPPTAVGFWQGLKQVTSPLVDCTILIGALVAVIKLQLFNLLGLRWRSDLNCRHHPLSTGAVVFIAEYVLTNSGQRPLSLTTVTIKLVGAKAESGILVPDENRVLARRFLQSTTAAARGMFDLQPGERSIFTLRALLDHLDDTVFVLCAFEISNRREPAGYRGFYCKYPALTQPAEAAGRPNPAI